jgi:hypothetical protein
VRIIYEGEVKAVTVLSTCQDCGTVFEYTSEDVYSMGEGKCDPYYRVRCPLPGCGRALPAEIMPTYRGDGHG